MQANIMPDPQRGTANLLWIVLVAVLSLVILIALVAVWALVADGNDKTDPAPLITTGTAALTGLLGLFVPATK